jgi:predicted nucleotidyltransferase
MTAGDHRERPSDTEAAEGITARVADALQGIEGMDAIVLGGSRARGKPTADADIDIGLYYRPGRPIDIAALRKVVRELDDRHDPDLVTELGEWGPWINGGAWLSVNGWPVDLLYRDLSLARETIDSCRRGEITVDYQAGHPHGFHNHIYVGEVHHARILYDPAGAIATLKELTDPYPRRLREAIVRTQLWEAGFWLELARKPTDRADLTYACGCLFQSTSCLVQALFALNETYLLNEKQSLALAAGFPLAPPNLGIRTEEILGWLGAQPDGLKDALGAATGLYEETRTLCSDADLSAPSHGPARD